MNMYMYIHVNAMSLTTSRVWTDFSALASTDLWLLAGTLAL